MYAATSCRRLLTVATAGALALTAALAATSPASARPMAAAEHPVPVPAHPYRVGVATYTLGDAAFTVPGFFTVATVNDPHPALQPMELTAVVHYPIDRSTARHPLAIVLHGDWLTCADRRAQETVTRDEAALDALTGDDPATQAEEDRLQTEITDAYDRLSAWPCASGTPAEPSYRGFDYLGAALARLGIVTVSISANGANAGILGEDQDRARAALISEHLALWAALDHGRGALRTGLHTSSGARLSPSMFRSRVDLSRVALIGHSRGGRGVFREAAAVNRPALPAGVRIRAVAGLAPINLAFLSAAQEARYLPKGIPMLQWFGSCDGNGGSDYLRLGLRTSDAPMVQVDAIGADHNFLNSQWSPSSGQVGANDDAHWNGEGTPGRCTDQTPPPVLRGDRPATTGKKDGIRQMTETQERRAATAVVSAFLKRYLLGDSGAERELTHPITVDRARVRLRTILPSGAAIGPRP